MLGLQVCTTTAGFFLVVIRLFSSLGKYWNLKNHEGLFILSEEIHNKGR
jgi:hypothetical protein